MQSVESKIELAIKSKPRGFLLFPEDFREKGSAESIRKALQSLKERKVIKQVAHGIYVRPKISEFIGEVMPTSEEVAIGISKRDRIRTVPTGAYALNALGLSTQVPMKIVLLTDGSSRTVKVGKRSIKFKKTTPKNLLATGPISRLVIQALKEIGIGKVTKEEENKIIEQLKQENQKALKHDIDLAPVWIQKIMKKSLQDVES